MVEFVPLVFNNIPKESSPDVSLPYIYVSLGLTGISPEDSEKLLIKPIEDEVSKKRHLVFVLKKIFKVLFKVVGTQTDNASSCEGLFTVALDRFRRYSTKDVAQLQLRGP